MKTETMTPNDLIQYMRVLKMSQIRTQLESDFNADPDTVKGAYHRDRYAMLVSFFADAKEQMM